MSFASHTARGSCRTSRLTHINDLPALTLKLARIDRENMTEATAMNWLNEYFLQKTSPLTLHLWAYPPLSFGPEGPLEQASWRLPHSGLLLKYVAGGKVEVGGREYALPARYEGTQQPGSLNGASTDETGRPLIRQVSIIAPSSFNSDFTVQIDDAFAFTPIFATEGAPGFFGTCMAKEDQKRVRDSVMKLPWLFQGYLSI